MKKIALYLLFILLFKVSSAQLTIYSGINLDGTSANCVTDTIYIGTAIPNSLNDVIKSISLNKGYMATFAENTDGTGERFTYMANKTNINISLAYVLQNKISFIRVIKLPTTVIKKRGVCDKNNDVVAALNTSWFYDWGTSDISTPTREFIPMTWSTKWAVDDTINKVIARDSLTHYLSFNEPDNNGQANMDVAPSIPLYKKLLRAGQRMGSPACTESQYRIWLDSFTTVANQQSLKIDFVAVHWYDWGNYSSTLNANPTATEVFNRFKTYIASVYDFYKKPIWITEFNANPNRASAIQTAFMQLALPWLDANPNVERYAYFFGNDVPVYNTGTTTLSPSGSYYSTYASVNAYPENIIDTRPSSPITLAAWDPSTFIQGGNAVSNFAPNTLDANLTAPSGLTRGSGVVLPDATVSSGYWGGTTWSTSSTDAQAGITANKFVKFSLKSKNSKSVNYNSIDKFNIRINNIGPIQYQIDYQLDAGSFYPVATLSGPTRTTGNYLLGPVDLSKIDGLQDVPTTSAITFRITPFDASGTGTFLIGSGTADTNPDLSIMGGYSDANTIVTTASNADLLALSLSSGSLSPIFAAATTSYTATVTSGISSITVTPTKYNVNASIEARVNGGSYVSVNSASASSALNLNVGNNTIEVRVTAQGGTPIKIYTVSINRQSNNADLSSLILSFGTLSPTFAAATTSYTATVTSGRTSITVTPTRANEYASKLEVNINGGSYDEIVTGNASSALSLNAGNNTINVRVTAQDGSTLKTYTVVVTRPSTNADLSALTISSGTLAPTFDAATTSYTTSVVGSVSSITVTPTVAEANATIQVRAYVTGSTPSSYVSTNSGTASGALNLSVGSNTVNIRVTAQDGTTLKAYTIVVTRLSAVATLSALTISSGTLSPVFATATLAYTATVTNATGSITVTPTSTSTLATIGVRVNGGSYTTVASGVASGALNLNVGSNVIDVLVTAQDGTLKTYTITVTRSTSATTWNGTSWSNGTPTATLDAVVASNTTTGSFSCRDLTINSGNTLNVGSGITVFVSGAITNNGAIVATSGTIEFNGTSAQSIPANVFSTNTIYGLTINNTAGVSLNGALKVTHLVTPTAGALITNNFLTLASSATGTAKVSAGTGTYIVGNVTVERFIPSLSRKKYTLVSSPVTSTINASWQEAGATVAGYGTAVTGGVAQGVNGFDGPATSATSIFTYDDTRVAGSKWVGLTSTTTAASLAPGKSYLIFVRGDRGENRPVTGNSSNTTLRATGIIGQGTVSPTLIATANKYTLIANPYPCTIDWNSAGITKTNLTASFIAYDTNLGVFITSNGTTKTPNVGQQQAGYIQSGQAFFVQAASTAATAITFTEAAKVTAPTTSSSTTIFGANDQSQLNINAYRTTGNVFADGVVALFGNQFNAAVDFKEDIAKFSNLNETFSLRRNEQALGLEARPDITSNDTLFFNLTNFGKRDYTFAIDGSNFTNATVMLQDAYLGTTQPIDLAGITNYPFTINDDIKSSSSDRFMITLGSTKPAAVPADAVATGLYVKMSPNPVSNQLLVSFKTATQAPTTIKIVNSLGQVVKTINAGSVDTGNITIPVSNLSKGIYIVQLLTDNKQISIQKIVKEK